MYKEDRHIEGINIEAKVNQSMEIPDDYFNQLQGRLERISEEQNKSSVHMIPFWLKIAVVALTCCLSIWLLKDSNIVKEDKELVSKQITWEDYEEFVGIETEDLILLDGFDETLNLLEKELNINH